MKKLIMLICIICLFSIPCSAKELDEKQAPVYARCIDNSYIGYESEVENGSAALTIDDITISVSGVNSNEKLTLIVMPITKQTDGYSWFKEVLSKHSNEIKPFDVYFLNENGERINVNTNFQVSLTVPKNFGNPEIYAIDTNENTTKINSSIINNSISFTANSTGYYAIVNRIESSTETPQTGDENNTTLVLVLLIVSALGILVVTKKRLTK